MAALTPVAILSSLSAALLYFCSPQDQQVKLLPKFIEAVLPYCVCQHNSIRATAAFSLVTVFSHAERMGYKEVQIPALRSIASYLLSNAELAQQVEKRQHYQHAQQLITCEFADLFYRIPLSDNAPASEVIPAEVFGSLSAAPAPAAPALPLLEVVEGELNLQRKIEPWQPGLEASAQRSARLGSDRRQKLRVIATFVDKVPNLAGLARTSEIFSVSALYVPNIKVLKDKEFQNISVSAESWLPVKQLKEEHLRDYLARKRARGWTLVGVEQTQNSQKLNRFVFPEKTVLLLGHEKEGLPIQYINCLDCCVGKRLSLQKSPSWASPAASMSMSQPRSSFGSTPANSCSEPLVALWFQGLSQTGLLNELSEYYRAAHFLVVGAQIHKVKNPVLPLLAVRVRHLDELFRKHRQQSLRWLGQLHIGRPDLL